MEEDWFFADGAVSPHPRSMPYCQTLKKDPSGFFVWKKKD